MTSGGSTASDPGVRAPAKPSILTVDDDPGVSRAVARDLRRRYGDTHRIVRAESGEQALDALRQMKLRGDAVAVLLADYRMPQMTGLQFLEAAMDLYPGARRVLLTAYADTDAAIEAINVVDLDYYLLKPWDPPEEKLYPVIDAQLEALGLPATTGPSPRPRSSGTGGRPARRRCASSWPATRCPTAGTRARARRAAAARGGRHRRARRCRWSSRRTATADDRAHRLRAGQPGRADDDAVEGLLRPRRHRRRAGRARVGGVRRVRGAAHGPDRAGRHRRTGRAEFADRELPRLPRRRVGRAADRPGPAAGAEVRRRADHHPRCGRRSRSTGRPAPCASPTASRSAAHTVILATGVSYRQLARRRHRPADRQGRVLRLGADRGGQLRRPGRLHRRRRELGRPGRRVPGPQRPLGDPARARRLAGRIDVVLPDPAARTTSRTSHVRTCTEVVGAHGEKSLEQITLRDRNTGDDRGRRRRVAVRLHRRRAAHRLARRASSRATSAAS